MTNLLFINVPLSQFAPIWQYWDILALQNQKLQPAFSVASLLLWLMNNIPCIPKYMLGWFYQNYVHFTQRTYFYHNKSWYIFTKLLAEQGYILYSSPSPTCANLLIYVISSKKLNYKWMKNFHKIHLLAKV